MLLLFLYFKDPDCNLFIGKCSVHNGFSIAIDHVCKNSKYVELPADNEGLFAYASSLPATDNITAVIKSVPDACKFNGLYCHDPNM